MTCTASIEEEKQRPGRRAFAWAAGLGVLGCGIACALPSILVIAVGGGAGASIAAHLEHNGGEVAAGLAVFATTLVTMVAINQWKRRRRRVRIMSSNSNSNSNSNSSSNSDNVIFQAKAAANAPLCCTADLKDKVAIGTQMEGYREAFKELLRAERIEGGFQWVFRRSSTLVGALKTLAQNEAACCSFFTFDLRADGEEIVWKVTAAAQNDKTRSVLDSFFDLPSQLRDGVNVGEIKDGAKRAGLEFAADRPR